jgi:Mn2+/Fe2+ NRAMP family transporter
LANNISGMKSYTTVEPGRRYRRWERIVVFLCLLDLAWFALAFHARPAAGEILRNTFIPSIPTGGLTASLVFLVVGIVGATIAPWQLFFQQSCIADKSLRFADLKWARLDTLIFATFTIIIAGCMMMTGNAALRHGFSFTGPAQMAVDLSRVFGPWFRTGILLLMINAAALGTTAISLSSAWAYGEVSGWTHSLQKSIKDAPGFYGVYVLCVGAAAGLVLIPRAPLQPGPISRAVSRERAEAHHYGLPILMPPRRSGLSGLLGRSVPEIGLMLAVVEELLARDLIVLDGIDGDFFAGGALTGGFGRDI